MFLRKINTRPECAGVALIPPDGRDFLANLALPYFDFTTWKTPNSYRNNYSPLPHESGIYMFVEFDLDGGTGKHDILYVGMSVDIARRIDGHEVMTMCRGRPGFIRPYFHLFAKDGIREIERAYIRSYNPPYNLIHRLKGVA